MYNESSKKATQKYIQEKRDKLTINIPKGKKEEIRGLAEKHGMSLTSYILYLIEKDNPTE